MFSVNQLAELVARCAEKIGFSTQIQNFPNPRIEMEEHYYNPVHTNLYALGLKPHNLEETLIESMLAQIKMHKEQIREETIRMNVRWKQS